MTPTIAEHKQLDCLFDLRGYLVPRGGGGRQGKPGVDEPVGGSALDVRRASAGVGGGGAG